MSMFLNKEKHDRNLHINTFKQDKEMQKLKKKVL